MIFDVIEKKLADSGIVVPGVSLFRGFLPAETKIGVLTRAPLTGIPVDPYIPGRYRANIQIITRHVDPVEGDHLANEVAKILMVEAPERHEFPEKNMTGSVSLFYPKTLPVQFPRLEGNGLEFSQHFDAVWTMSEFQ